MNADARCGSNRGYFAHRRRSEDACDACRAAHYEDTAARAAVRAKALRRLAAEYPERFSQILDEERRAA